MVGKITSGRKKRNVKPPESESLLGGRVSMNVGVPARIPCKLRIIWSGEQRLFQCETRLNRQYTEKEESGTRRRNAMKEKGREEFMLTDTSS